MNHNMQCQGGSSTDGGKSFPHDWNNNLALYRGYMEVANGAGKYLCGYYYCSCTYLKY